MSTITQCFQPPLYWQEFEDLTEGVFRAVYGDPKPTKFGRPGQAQDGVDVYGRDSNDSLVGVQCKRMDELDENNHPRPGGKIMRKHLRKEIEGAKRFSPKLHTWVLATTAKRDANIQRYALQLDEQSRAGGSFGIQLWFWDDFITDLNRNHDLQRWYYDKVIQIQSSDDQDKIILDMIGEAFARPAFRIPLHQEGPSEFLQALKDTQHAISTGELKDRETRRVIRKTIGGRRAIEDQQVRAHLQAAYDALHELRVRFNDGIRDGLIQESCGQLQISASLLPDLDSSRNASISEVNAALTHAGLPAI